MCLVRHAWCICDVAVTSVDLLLRSERRRRRALSGAVVAYGAVGLVLVVLLALALAPALGAVEALDRSSAQLRDTLATTR